MKCWIPTLLFVLAPTNFAADAQIDLTRTGADHLLSIHGSSAEWRFQISSDLASWIDAPALGSVYGNSEATRPFEMGTDMMRVLRAVKTSGLFDTNLLRTVSLTFTNANWLTLLASARTSGGNVPARLELNNGAIVTNAGARYKGNTSYTMGGTKKSVNLDLNYADPDARLMSYRAINLNNAAGDNTIMREPLYFDVMREYAPSPHGALARLVINDANWGVYSMVDQINNDLIDEWFPSHEGDRWRAPNVGGGVGGGGRPGGGGGGGFDSPASAFSYLGANVSSYTNNYELKSDNSTNAWQRLLHAIDVLNNTSADQLRDKVEDVFAVDRWLWFLAVENIFVDDDSYWNKGADYAFYYEPESGRIHPVEHDGNEAFTSAMGITYTLSPVAGATGTNRPLLYRLLPIPELRQRYLAHLRTVLQEKFNPAAITPVIDHFRSLSRQAINDDPKKSFTISGYDSAVVALKTYITNRYNFLTNHAELRPLQPNIVSVTGPENRPSPVETPTITAHVIPGASNEGIDSVWLYWRDKTYGRFSVAQMFDDGAHNDGTANDGIFGAATADFPAGHKIHYYVEARSSNSTKTAAFSPARAEQQTYSYRVGLETAPNTEVVINELLASNSETLADPQGDFDDWIELHNITDHEVDLTGKYLSDTENNPTKWLFPSGTKVAANGYLLVWADEDGSATEGLHANFKLSAAGEEVYLFDTDANSNVILDSITFGPQDNDVSWGRSAQNADEFVSMKPTPNAANE